MNVPLVVVIRRSPVAKFALCIALCGAIFTITQLFNPPEQLPLQRLQPITLVEIRRRPTSAAEPPPPPPPPLPPPPPQTTIPQFDCSATSKKPVYFLHLSKAGGTNFCYEAYRNGCATTPAPWEGLCDTGKFCDLPTDNCAQFQADLPGGFRAEGLGIGGTDNTSDHPETIGMPCEKRRALVRRDKLGFFAVERFFDDYGQCNRPFTYYLRIREPVSCVVSYLNMQYGHDVQWGNLDMSTVDVEAILRTERSMSGKDILARALSQHMTTQATQLPTLSNHLVRFLNGEQAMFLAHDELTREHLQSAKRIVKEQIDFIDILEDKELREVIFGEIGFTAHNHTFGSAVKPVKLSQIETTLLAEMNTLDTELYFFAWTLARQRFGLDAVSKGHNDTYAVPMRD